MKTIIRKGYVAMNKGEFDDLQNMTFFNKDIQREFRNWKGQDILEVEIKLKQKIQGK